MSEGASILNRSRNRKPLTHYLTDGNGHTGRAPALSDPAPRVEEVRRVLALDALRVSQELNRRPTRAHGEWLRPARAMRERIMPTHEHPESGS